MNDKSTLIFVIEINGKSVLAFNADSQIDAERKAQNPMLCSDLMVFETADGPLWNGEDEIVVREAVPAERETGCSLAPTLSRRKAKMISRFKPIWSISSTRKTRPRVRSR